MTAESEAIRFLCLPVVNELTKCLNLKSGAREEFRKLKEGLPFLEAFLTGKAINSNDELVRKEIELVVSDLIYEVEDTIETYSTKTAAAMKKNAVRRFFGKYFSINLDKRIKSLNEIMQPMVADIKKEGFGTSPGPSSSSSSEVIEEQPKNLDRVVKFEDEETIIGYLKRPKDKLDVISIIGMAGLGKSTLAWKIYHDKKNAEEFELCVWIHVSQKFKSWDLFLKILRKITPQDMWNPRDEEELINTVSECLANNKFLLVLDDVWSTQHWDVIRQILPQENKNGKVLVTSRDTKVGEHASTSPKSHMLIKIMDPNRSWELLQLNVFGDEQRWPQDLRKIGEKIAYKCGGVPLTIVVIGGIIKNDLATTKVLCKERLIEILRDVNLICSQDDKINNLISKTIQLSYDTLPYKLRKCFLYLGMFPDNEEIPVVTLTQLWIAEGFIQEEDRKSLERSAESVLNDLINMNLLMVGRKHLHQVKTCRVHDMMREFCISKAGEENFFRLIKEFEGRIGPPVSDNFHRVCLHSDINTFLSTKPKGPQVRSFLCFCKETINMEGTHKKAIPEAFSVLRVLNCKSIKFGQFPDLTKLILLKHITLSIENLGVLPKQISQLLNLQSLVVETKSYSVTVKANIWKMVKLRHIKTKAAMLLNDKWKAVTDGNLQTLTRLSPESCTNLSAKASLIKTLGIRGKLANLLSTISLQNFKFLEKLKLVNESSSENPLLIPQPNLFPVKLKKMTLSKTYLQWNQHMPILAQITTLEVLKLKDNAFIGVYWEDVSNHAFPKLQFLLISDTELVNWKTSTTHFPSLKWLTLRKCRDLLAIPDDLEAKLEKLEIEHVKKTAVESAKRIEERKKLQAEQNQPSVLEVPFVLTIGPGCN